MDLYAQPHRRYNPLTGEWVLVSPHRALRPWQGQVEPDQSAGPPAYDPGCYLCPGNGRAGGLRNPDYTSTYVFDNDFAALLPPAAGPVPVGLNTPLFRAEPEAGLCRVVCFSPRHDLTLPQLPLAAVRAVIHTWAEQSDELGRLPFVNYVQVFENKGAAMGCSNPHPHSQIWAGEHLPNEPAKELAAQRAYRSTHGRCLLCDYLEAEEREAVRVVAANAHFVAVVPFGAVWPFEILLAGRRHLGSLAELRGEEVDALAGLLQQVLTRYDNLFSTSFPYSMGFHQAPTDGGDHSGWHLHLHAYPPLLRSATVKKFMVGYELLAMPQRDLSAETAAQRLRETSDRHYLSGS
ncbi:MAG: UDP-glucose--hexose-1-phosphate uridylyltransferase [Candidatus Latescibacteria bacterium]|nr:UDP-glucose--hexose-1-phosphate uridylyltransferase [Candidatus Latescibacterota bacterium]